MIQNKQASRAALRQRRRLIPPADRRRFNDAIQQVLFNSGLLRRSQHIAGYLANDGEPCIAAFTQRCEQGKQSYYLPIVKKQRLLFARYQTGDLLINNQYHIAEPVAVNTLPAKFISVILMPLVGFDHQGNRMGMGGGFYDRTLSFIRRKPCKQRPLLIGIAYSLQSINHINKRPWDIPLDAVVNENGLLLFSNKAIGLLRKTKSAQQMN